MKQYKLDQKICDFIEQHAFFFYFVGITVIAGLIRYVLRNEKSDDMLAFLLPWFKFIKENGGIAALGMSIGDYNIPYLFLISLLTYLPFNPVHLIKGLSILFEFLLALCASRFVVGGTLPDADRKFRQLMLYAVILLSPTVILNGAWWGQCDAIYSLFLILAVLSCCKGKYLGAICFFAIAFAFKLQAVFWLPVLLCLYIRSKKFPLYYFLAIPCIYVVGCIPAVLAGRPIWEALTIYLTQTSEYYYMTLHYPNLYYLVKLPYEPFFQVAIFFAGGVLGSGMFLVIYRRMRLNTENILYFSIWTIWSCCMFLPHIHERYGFCMEILLIIYSVVYGKKIFTTVCLNLVILCSYTEFCFSSRQVDWYVLALVNFALYLMFTVEGYRKLEGARSQTLSE